MRVEVGNRVIIEFGKQKILTAVVVDIGEKEATKSIIEVLGDAPVLFAQQIQLWAWMAGYYLCSEGEVMAAAIPSGLKLSSESFLQPNPVFSRTDELEAQELLVWEKMSACKQITYGQLIKLMQETLGQIENTLWGQELKQLSLQKAIKILKSLLEKNAFLTYEKVIEKYQPKKVAKIRLKQEYLQPEALNEVFSLLSKKPICEQLLLKYLTLTKVHLNPNANQEGLDVHLLGEADTKTALKTLVKKGIFEPFEAIKPRFALLDTSEPKSIQLSAIQRETFIRIVQLFEKQSTVLLHGVTGSGKTEVYIELADRVLFQGGQVLILVPEIALTVQTVERFRQVFGSKLGIYHSKFSDKERVEIWQGVYEQKFQVVVGVRSAVFLPFSNLGLVIVDEEHDPSYKQADPAPRYHARDTAIVLAQQQGAKVLLGSATPSLESWHNAQTGRYGFVQILDRHGDSVQPEFVFADLKFYHKTKSMRGGFSQMLLDEIAMNKTQGKQSILFLNKRGYSPQIQCLDCGDIPQCIRCSVSLTYHLSSNELRCHYCGWKQPLGRACVACGSSKLKTIGMGTEKVEDELKLFLPDLSVVRMDSDTTRSKKAFERILEDFAAGKVDVLTGTQMVTKGLDFDRVGLVGVMDADRLLYFPDFRNHERTFQLLLQVAGRAGRRSQRGRVIIQTTQPQHFVLRCVAENNFERFYNHELVERQKFNYPPFSRLVVLTIKSNHQQQCQKAAENLCTLLRKALQESWIMDVSVPIVEKINELYHRTVFIKLPKTPDLPKHKAVIDFLCYDFVKIKDYGNIFIKMDVDAI